MTQNSLLSRHGENLFHCLLITLTDAYKYRSYNAYLYLFCDLGNCSFQHFFFIWITGKYFKIFILFHCVLTWYNSLFKIKLWIWEIVQWVDVHGIKSKDLGLSHRTPHGREKDWTSKSGIQASTCASHVFLSFFTSPSPFLSPSCSSSPLLSQTHADTHTKCKSSFLFFYLNSTIKIVICPFSLLLHIFKITYLNLNSLPTPLETKDLFFKFVHQLHFI